MSYAEVTPGDIDDGVVNVIIEIRKNERNKYEFDKDTGRLFLDRVNGTTLGYPADYGYIPGTLCEDGDPLDALLIIDESVPHGTVVPSRPIGVLYFEDDGEMDEMLRGIKFEIMTENIFFQRLASYVTRGVLYSFFFCFKMFSLTYKQFVGIL